MAGAEEARDNKALESCLEHPKLSLYPLHWRVGVSCSGSDLGYHQVSAFAPSCLPRRDRWYI